MPDTLTPPIHELLTPATIQVGLPGSTKTEALHNLVSLFIGHPSVADLEALENAVLAREAMLSTGVGFGLGLPHAKTTAVRETLAAFAVTASPLPFDAIDGEPVRLLFLLIGPPTNNSQHIRILARLSRLMNHADLRAQLLEAPDVATVLAILADAEQHLLDGKG